MHMPLFISTQDVAKLGVRLLLPPRMALSSPALLDNVDPATLLRQLEIIKQSEIGRPEGTPLACVCVCVLHRLQLHHHAYGEDHHHYPSSSHEDDR